MPNVGNAKKGYYKAIHPNKLLSNKVIQYRSSWELYYMNYLDKNNNVEKWGSENIIIPYFNKIKNRKARYFVDFQVKLIDKSVFLVEVKPFHETQPPIKRSSYALASYITNTAKWKACYNYCKLKGWGFYILTEKGIFKYG